MKKNHRNIIIVTVIIIIIFSLFILQRFLLIKPIYEEHQHSHDNPPILRCNATETEDFWVFTVIDFEDALNEDDLKHFFYRLDFKNEQNEVILREYKSFENLTSNKSKYFDFFDEDNNDKVTSNDLIIVQKYFNESRKYPITIEITHVSFYKWETAPLINIIENEIKRGVEINFDSQSL